MAQAESVTEFMQRNTVDINILSHLPVLILIEVQIPGQRLAVGRSRIKRVRQHFAGAVKRISIAVTAAAPQDADRPRCRRIVAFDKIDLNHARPFAEGARYLRLLRLRVDLLTERPIGKLQRSPPLTRSVPTLTDRLHQRSYRSGLSDSARTPDQRRTVHQLLTGRKHIGDLVPTHQRL